MRAGSSRAVEAIRTGEVDAQEIARIEKAREAWARRFERRSARNWAYAASALSGPVFVGLCALFILLGAPLPIPEDAIVFILPSIVFFYLGGLLALMAAKREHTVQDLRVLVAGLISPIVSIFVLFGGDWVLTQTKLGGEPDSAPRAAALLALIWTANALLGCWYGERRNVYAEQEKMRAGLPKEARARDSGAISTRGFKAISERALTSGRVKVVKPRAKGTETDRHAAVTTNRHKAVK